MKEDNKELSPEKIINVGNLLREVIDLDGYDSFGGASQISDTRIKRCVFEDILLAADYLKENKPVTYHIITRSGNAMVLTEYDRNESGTYNVSVYYIRNYALKRCSGVDINTSHTAASCMLDFLDHYIKKKE